MIQITNEDNMELMARYPDKYFDLAIVDPPYGINMGMGHKGSEKRGDKNKYKTFAGGDNSIPTKEYFNELFRVSKNQIIWGGNYFIEHLKNTRCYINWDKLNHSDTYADCEMAWTSFNENAKIFKYMWDGNRYGFPNAIQGVGKKSIRTHPTQKPVSLYHYCLTNYAKENDKILDTHLGSGSIAIACHDYKYDLTACELDKEYFDKAIERITNHTNQTKLF